MKYISVARLRVIRRHHVSFVQKNVTPLRAFWFHECHFSSSLPSHSWKLSYLSLNIQFLQEMFASVCEDVLEIFRYLLYIFSFALFLCSLLGE